MFVAFWTRHKFISFKQCDEHCSRVFVSDGHQKADRLVCSFNNVCEVSIDELGPILLGCPETPTRDKNNEQKRTKFYCEKHRLLFNANEDTILSSSPLSGSALERPIYDNQTIQQKALILEEEDNQFIEKSDQCNVHRDGMEARSKLSSYEFVATFLNCGIIIGFDEQPRSVQTLWSLTVSDDVRYSVYTPALHG
ncbi:unnamed protein product [Didymodactylos carnosus]|uniref:Uncharacterized protein n=1 Tax=Didymodactylos carnosus TaxID=1234261 RepID=A0A814IZP2_9BILA|nr:unnamed protein product [Didymodactylos carnosus]CAF3801380.1 unnamed protein product [Didymodactylos carnosus]